MSACLRLFAVFVGTVVVLVAASRLAPRLMRDLGLDWGSLCELYRQQEQERSRAAELQRRDGVLLVRIQEKGRVVRRLIAGEVTLLQAAAAFKRLNDAPPAFRDERHRAFPAASEGESLCRQVIQWVEADLRSRGVDDLGIVDGLRGELDDILARDGTVEPPTE
jgi:hypothetical protein